MSTFDELVELPGVGVSWLLDVSLDNFVTYFKRYATKYVAYDGNAPYVEARIAGLSPLAKSFGLNRGMTATTFGVTLQNLDGGADWLADRITYGTQATIARFRLRCFVYRPGNHFDNATKDLGYYVLMNPPTRDTRCVRFDLVDDALGAAAELSATPSVCDWIAITDANRPAFLTASNVNGAFVGSVPGFDYNAPLPLKFGGPFDDIECTYVGRNCYVICAVAGSAGALPTAIDGFNFNNGDGGTFSLKATIFNQYFAATQVVWTVRRTPDIVKNGKTFHLLWVDFDMTGDGLATPGASEIPYILARETRLDVTNTVRLFDNYGIHDLIAPVTAHGWLFSHPVDDVNRALGIHATQVVEDLLTYYTPVALTVDGASFDAIRVSRPAATAAGSISPYEDTSPIGVVGGQLNKAIAALGSMGVFDVFFTWAGVAKAANSVADFATLTATVPTFTSVATRDDITDRVRGRGERNAPYNRLVVGRPDGRIAIDNAASVADWGGVKTKYLDGTWIGQFPGRLVFFGLIDPTVRPMITLRTFLNGLKYDLGDYLRVTWARPDSTDIYTDAVMRVEAINVDMVSASVRLELLWVNDFFDGSVTPYVLDDETLSTRATGSGGRTVTLTTASTTVSFSSGNLVSDGVAVGDQLIVLDATEAADGYFRNRVLTITGSIAATSCVVDASDFSTGGPFVISTWEIRRSQLTYRSNATIYGKTSDASGQFGSPLIAANKLLDG